MNKIIIYVLLLLVILGVSSCKKTLEDQPLNLISKDYIFDPTDPSGFQAQQFVVKIYSQEPTAYTRLNGAFLDCASDDCVPSNRGSATWNVINGGYSPLATFDDNWSNSYSAIRKANMFLANYQVVPWADQNIRRWMVAESRGLRAYFYYELIRRYGGVPILDDKVFDANDPAIFQVKRSSFSDCVNYVVSELTAVQDSLRPDASIASRGAGNGVADGSDPDAGRIRKSVCLALKAKVLLLAASPLFNASTTPDKDYTGYPAYDKERWKAAADAAKAVMDLNLFALETNRYILNTTRINKEFIMAKYGNANQATLGPILSPVGYVVGTTASTGVISPTQELVDAFPMSNGKAISDPTSGYNPTAPYANRDPRLDQTVFFNGATWLKRAVETFEGGKDKPNSTAVAGGIQTQTGYYAKKFLANDANNTTWSPTIFTTNTAASFALIRYADILLMYAEAQNEYLGAPDASVYNAVQAIRQRAGLVPFTLPAGLTQAQMRDVIRNERRLELAFEEARFYDLRRWKLAKATYGNGALHGVNIVKNANGTFTYTPTNVVTPYFNDANMNLLPINNSEIIANPNIKQNPNY